MDKYTEYHIEQSALVTIDTQNDFTLVNAPAYISGTQDVVPNIARLLDIYRKKELPIFHVVRFYLRDGSNAELCRKSKIESGTSMVVPETPGAELVETLKPGKSISLKSKELLAGKFQKIGKNEYVMYKSKWGAFYKTPFEDFLKEKGVTTLLFTGCNFPNCPRTSIYEASERDFRLMLASDAMSQLYKKGEDEMKDIGVHVFSTDELTELLS